MEFGRRQLRINDCIFRRVKICPDRLRIKPIDNIEPVPQKKDFRDKLYITITKGFFMFKRIAHVCLNVRDLARSVDYYSTLGFSPVFRFTREGALFGAYLKISEGNYIEMFEDKNLTDPQNTGIAHFCLETEDIDGVIEKLRAKGVSFTPKKKGCDNTYQIWLTDPDGNQFEVHQYTDKSSQLTGEDVEADW